MGQPWSTWGRRCRRSPRPTQHGWFVLRCWWALAPSTPKRNCSISDCPGLSSTYSGRRSTPSPSTPPRARLGVVSAGYTYATTLRALKDMGLDAEACRHLGLRLIKISAPWPLDGADLRRLTAGLEEVLVIEDKTAFIESQIKESLYGCPDSHSYWARSTRRGSLSPGERLGDSDTVARVLATRIPADRIPAAGHARMKSLARRQRLVLHLAPPPTRTATFCSGCPTTSRPAPRRRAGGSGHRLSHNGRLRRAGAGTKWA